MFCISGIINENFPTFFLKHKREKCFFAKVPEMEYKREKVPNFYLFPNSPKCPQSQPKINWQLVDLQFIPTRQTDHEAGARGSGWFWLVVGECFHFSLLLLPNSHCLLAQTLQLQFFSRTDTILYIFILNRVVASNRAMQTQISALQPYCRQAHNINARLNR